MTIGILAAPATAGLLALPGALPIAAVATVAAGACAFNAACKAAMNSALDHVTGTATVAPKKSGNKQPKANGTMTAPVLASKGANGDKGKVVPYLKLATNSGVEVSAAPKNNLECDYLHAGIYKHIGIWNNYVKSRVYGNDIALKRHEKNTPGGVNSFLERDILIPTQRYVLGCADKDPHYIRRDRALYDDFKNFEKTDPKTGKLNLLIGTSGKKIGHTK